MHELNDPEATRKWAQKLAPFAKAINSKAVGQLLTTLIPYGLLWYGMYRSLEVGYLWMCGPIGFDRE